MVKSGGYIQTGKNIESSEMKMVLVGFIQTPNGKAYTNNKYLAV